MHGTFPVRDQALRTPPHAFGSSAASSASDGKAVGKTAKPENDPRTKAYIEG